MSLRPYLARNAERRVRARPEDADVTVHTIEPIKKAMRRPTSANPSERSGSNRKRCRHNRRFNRWRHLQPGSRHRNGRPSGDVPPKSFRHRADLSTARSYHLQISSPDPDAVLKQPPTATAPDGSPVGLPHTFEQARRTDEIFSTYISRYPRPQWAEFTITFELRLGAKLAYLYAIILVAVGLVASWRLTVSGEVAAVLTIPTTLAATYLLTTDTSLLAGLRRGWRIALASLSLLLWAVVLWKLRTAGLTGQRW